ncbi:MAG: YggS family pyridoxal phosphate-dependent enzyme [Armatimonadetes bacterium]|nr:YggS family pyridoxal phosphate-dependent enzyme [Armatimonadota bacterium]
MGSIAENLQRVRERIATAAARAGRDPELVRLVAVTKHQPASAVREALEAGVTEVGENYVQEAEEKWGSLGTFAATRHLIGHLQRNKAGKAAALFHVVQTVDSLPLAQALGRRALSLNRTLEVLVEVNLSREPSKSGVDIATSLELCEQVREVAGLRLCGMMGMGTAQADPTETRRSFDRLARLFDELPTLNRQVLSMGMTGDFEIAIEAGSTMVRVGTGIFGPRGMTG